MKHLGITGTRRGMTWQQTNMFAHLLATVSLRGFEVFHDGDCVGVDVEARLCAYDHGYVLVVHPSTAMTRAYLVVRGQAVLEPKPPLVRNKDIVDASDLMVGCPGEDHEALRSGTWACLRYTGKAKKSTLIIWPDGRVSTYKEGYNGDRSQ